MEKNDTIVTDMVIQALKMDDTIKRQEVIIERLKTDKKEMLDVIVKLKSIITKQSPDLARQLELFKI